MIFYLASYPRSGNSWMRDLISHYFGLKTASLYHDDYENPNLPDEEPVNWDSLLYEYTNLCDYSQKQRGLFSNCGRFIDKTTRERLSEEKGCLFLKTHELPFGEYYEGEYCIHIVRHPGAIFWSYYNYLVQGGASPDLTIEQVIEGRVFTGSWSVHTTQWLEAGQILGDRYLRVQYEDLVDDVERVLKGVERFTDLTRYEREEPFPEFSALQEKDSRMYRAGMIDEWTNKLNATQKSLIWALHIESMERLGYSIPPDVERERLLIPQKPSSELPSKEEYIYTKAFQEGLRKNVLRLTESIADQEQNYLELIENKQRGIEFLQTKLENLERGNDALKREIQQKQHLVEDLQMKIETIEIDNETLQREINHNLQRFKVFEAKIETLTHEKASLNKVIQNQEEMIKKAPILRLLLRLGLFKK